MRVVDAVDGDNIKNAVRSDVVDNQIIKTDGYKAYKVIKRMGHRHKKKVVRGKSAHTIFKWVHILSSNAKTFLRGTYHGIDRKHLQAYLNEFCYRFNRRKWEHQLFARLVAACVSSPGIIYSELTK